MTNEEINNQINQIDENVRALLASVNYYYDKGEEKPDYITKDINELLVKREELEKDLVG